MDEEISFENFLSNNDQEANNPIIDTFKKMMDEQRTSEYDTLFNIESEKDFYDDDADSNDEKEIQKEFKSHFIDDPIESDAVLNCPGCMSLLTIDCQQHEIYHNQFRAMFVENCKIDKTESVICPIASNKTPAPQSKPGDIFHSVYCEICNTKVGVVDQNSVYHFFNVLPSD